MYVVVSELNTRGCRFAPRPTALPTVHSLWITLWITLLPKRGRALLSAGIQMKLICPLIKIIPTVRQLRLVCLPFNLLIGNKIDLP